MNQLMTFLLNSSTVITPQAKGASAGGAAAQGANGGFFGGSNGLTIMIVYVVALILIMYFLSVRPTRKREKALAEQRNAIQVGDTVLTNSGFYGKVTDITYECFVIEFGQNKGVRVPVVKSEVFGKKEPNLSNEAPPEEEKPQKKKGLFKSKEE